MSTPSELATVYAALILHDDCIAITAEKIAALIKAAGVEVESYWPSLFAKLLEKKSVDDLIMNVGSGGGSGAVTMAAPSAGGAAAAPAAAAVEEKQEEPKDESDDDLGFSLFD
ncbi:60S acidic ribosomal protein like [Actinidia chinensis var. chinensis]|uniref:60S acidic ribosomal protein like n=1 Tax=Actinidia chinensis var. chinensis TaxID=1590841 RepID=A0A2R6RSF3_ACTCC|nr:60S acidic ribosomal protein like [Actinidia chinensis var. chinensis]